MEFVMKKLFSVSLKDKASDWYKLLDNSDLLEWQELMSLFYAKFYLLGFGVENKKNSGTTKTKPMNGTRKMQTRIDRSCYLLATVQRMHFSRSGRLDGELVTPEDEYSH